MKYLLVLIIALHGLQAQSQDLTAAIKEFNEQRLDNAKTMFKSIKSNSPDYAEALFYLGRIAFDQKEFDNAVDYFEDAIDKNDMIAKYYTWYGNAIGTVTQSASKLRQGILAPKIKNAYKRATELDPSDLDAQWGLLQFYSQAPGFMGGSWENALKAAEDIGKINQLEGHRAKATVYQRQEEWSLAEMEFVALAELDPRFLGSLGVFYQNRGNYTKSSEAFEKDLKVNKENWGSVYQIGKNSALSGTNLTRGIECLNLYLAAERGENLPSHAGANARLGMIYAHLGEKEKAKALFEKALKQDPKMELAKEGLEKLKN
uniref:tetratricopeptide repeat protein n=3 Tax=Roseivirga sp. TaxID=1964215 RepID=UPI004048AA97